MSVVGYDFGNLNCYVAVARQGGIDVLTNDYSLHATPTCVSFGEKSRTMGVAARQQVNTNFRNTVINFKHLLGRKFSDPVTQLYKKFVPCEIIQLTDDNIGLKINYLGETRTLTPEQVTAAFLTKMKTITENSLGERVNDCVISVPYFFSDNQRRALLAAGKIAGVNLLKIVNEPTAVGIAYGIYKGSSLPAEKEAPKKVAFVDVGHSCVQASVMDFNDRKVKVLGAAHDLTVGGLFFDELIREYFHAHFLKTYNLDARKNPKAWLRLLDESEKLKKQMSANKTAIPLAIECFMDDKDVKGAMERSQFEELAEPLFQKIRNMLARLLENANVKKEEIHEVEVIGGSSRIPYIKQIIANFFNREPRTTMNLDEAVARGSGMQCAILSPSFKVKEFHVVDKNLFDIKLRYEGSKGVLEQVIFKRHDEFPLGKKLTVEKMAGFNLEAFYVNPESLPYPVDFIGRWTVHNVEPTSDGQPRLIKVKARLNANGIFSVYGAETTELQNVDDMEDEEPETDSKANGDNKEKHNDDKTAQGDVKSAENEPAKKEKKPKKVIVEFPVQEQVPYSLNLDECIALEKEMQSVDWRMKQTSDSKNALEEYCYNMRDKLTESLAAYVTADEVLSFQSQLAETEEWLYGDGEEATKEKYDDKLHNLRNVIETPINQRRGEIEQKEREELAAAQANAPSEKAKTDSQQEMDVD
jgi:molecular chaperone DnaK (HSP70)